MIRFRNHHGYQHTPDDESSGSDEAVLSSSPRSLEQQRPSLFQQPPPQQSPPPQPPRQLSYPVDESIMTAAASNADTIMDLAATIPSSKIVYQLEEKKTAEQDEEVERIVSAVTKGLRKNKSSPRRKPTGNSNSNNNSNNNNNPAPRPPRTSKGSKMVVKPKANPNRKSGRLLKPKKKIATTSTGVEVVPIVSDEDSSSSYSAEENKPRQRQRQRPKPKPKAKPKQKQKAKQDPGFFGRMMLDDSVASSAYTGDDTVDCEYNYIDDESYGNTSEESSSSSSSYSSESSSSSREERGIRHERNFDGMEDDHSSQASTASLTTEVESSFDTIHENKILKDQQQQQAEADDEETHSYRRDSNTPQGLDIVAHLLSGAKDISLDAYSIHGNSAHEIARDVSEALAHTSSLQKVSFCGPWKGQSNKARQILEILFDGLLQNNSVHTLVLQENHCLDRYAGYAFGTFLKAHNSHGASRLQKLEIFQCKFVGSGWNSLFLGLQHSTTIKRLAVEDCIHMTSDDMDCITSTIQYLNLEYLKLSNVQLHKTHNENLAFFLRAVQQTKSLKEVDLSRNNLGASPRAMNLLARCLSGDSVWMEHGAKDKVERDFLPINYQHHIEKLVLTDCGIADKSSVRTLAKAVDSSIAKLDANNNEAPLVLHTLDLSKNRFGNSGAKILEKLLENNPSITHLGMLRCGVSASHLKTISDRLRYNNSFLQKIGLSSNVSLAILDSVSAVEHVFTGRNPQATTADTGTLANEDVDSDLEATSRMSACGGC